MIKDNWATLIEHFDALLHKTRDFEVRCDSVDAQQTKAVPRIVGKLTLPKQRTTS